MGDTLQRYQERAAIDGTGRTGTRLRVIQSFLARCADEAGHFWTDGRVLMTYQVSLVRHADVIQHEPAVIVVDGPNGARIAYDYTPRRMTPNATGSSWSQTSAEHVNMVEAAFPVPWSVWHHEQRREHLVMLASALTSMHSHHCGRWKIARRCLTDTITGTAFCRGCHATAEINTFTGQITGSATTTTCTSPTAVKKENVDWGWIERYHDCDLDHFSTVRYTQ